MIAPIIPGATIKDGQLVEYAEYYSADMIVSITRHRRAVNDTTYTYQFPLFAWKRVRGDQTYDDLIESVLNRLGLASDPVGSSIVWRMEETGQIAFVRSPASLFAAIIDHKNAGKKTVQLFIVKNDNVTCVPGLDIAK
ncbi:MAG: hypothetical protein AUREO_002380 [Aureobasidium pullulans]|nr:MAG: hypothetical protein AUREO_002380 [Aureobasidium pullulans]THZ02591.1 hypothetical protein D6C92_00500 [Aureobasidium pullulans]THZ51926.1 hypothetical protein D6C90_01497 [Aureobasidium pullulans]